MRIDVDPMDLQRPGGRDPNYEEVAGYSRWFGPNPCSSCELKEIIGRLFPAPWRPPVEDPATAELRQLRAELASADAHAPPEAPAPVTGALFPVAEPVRITPAALTAAGRLAGSDAQAEAYCLELLALHLRGDHGLVGQHQDGDATAGSGGNPLASQADRNAAAIEEGRGSIRSVFLRTRTETFRDPHSDFQERAGATHRAEFACRTELPAGLTAIGLAEELAGSG